MLHEFNTQQIFQCKMQCNSNASDAGGTGWNGRIRKRAGALHMYVHLGSIGNIGDMDNQV